MNTYKNRGMFLENIINESNIYYNHIKRSLIYKKPTPIKVLKVSYPSNYSHSIDKAVFSSISTLDYNGIYKGKYIDFEAKETKLKSFPLANIHKHQIEHLNRIVKHGGIGFIIVSFTSLDKVFLLEEKYLMSYIESNKRKSIPIEYFEENGYLIKYNFNPRLDYLSIINRIYFEGDVLWKNF